MTLTNDAWPGGATYVFQGTVAEDATAGTHLASATFTPGAGGEMQFLFGVIQVGNTATAQAAEAVITDGTNNLTWVMNPQAVTNTLALERYVLPQSGQNTAALIGTDIDFAGPVSLFMISGAMTFLMRVTTTAVSVTHTFAAVFRIKGALPTATLADPIGTPVLTTNTNRVF